MGLLQLLGSGQTAEIVANAKPFMIPIFAFSNNKKTIKQLSLTGSVHAYKSSMHSDHEKNLQSIMKILKERTFAHKRVKICCDFRNPFRKFC